jgi:hypothetical protein
VCPLAAIGLLVLAVASPAQAKTSTKIAATKVEFSIARAADGTVTVKATFTSSNPHCLSRDRWKQYPSGEYKEGAPEFGLYYGGVAWADPPGRFGAQLAPVSPFGRSPLVWRAIWPGSAGVIVENHAGKTEAERSYRSTVSEAIGVDGGANTMAFEDRYKISDDKVLLKCRPVNERVRNQLFASRETAAG